MTATTTVNVIVTVKSADDHCHQCSLSLSSFRSKWLTLWGCDFQAHALLLVVSLVLYLLKTMIAITNILRHCCQHVEVGYPVGR